MNFLSWMNSSAAFSEPNTFFGPCLTQTSPVLLLYRTVGEIEARLVHIAGHLENEVADGLQLIIHMVALEIS